MPYANLPDLLPMLPIADVTATIPAATLMGTTAGGRFITFENANPVTTLFDPITLGTITLSVPSWRGAGYNGSPFTIQYDPKTDRFCVPAEGGALPRYFGLMKGDGSFINILTIRQAVNLQDSKCWSYGGSFWFIQSHALGPALDYITDETQQFHFSTPALSVTGFNGIGVPGYFVFGNSIDGAGVFDTPFPAAPFNPRMVGSFSNYGNPLQNVFWDFPWGSGGTGSPSGTNFVQQHHDKWMAAHWTGFFPTNTSIDHALGQPLDPSFYMTLGRQILLPTFPLAFNLGGNTYRMGGAGQDGALKTIQIIGDDCYMLTSYPFTNNNPVAASILFKTSLLNINVQQITDTLNWKRSLIHRNAGA